MSQPVAVAVEEVTKHFGRITAIDAVSFSVFERECFGFLGPNGAGKTTLIRILAGLLRPTSGRASVAGFDVQKEPDQVRRAIGMVAQAPTSDLDLTARENLDIFGRYYGVSRHDRKERMARLLSRVGLSERADDLIATYSGGMRRRLEIARGLIHSPKILFLDEPTIGLDPQSRRSVWELLHGLLLEGLTLFLTTHYMEEADFLCNRVAIIDQGKIAALDRPDELKRKLPGSDIIEIEIEGSEETAVRAEDLARPLARKIVREERLLKVYVDDGTHLLPGLLGRLAQEAIRTTSVRLSQQSLEDVFLHYTGRSIREEAAKKVSLFVGAGVPRRWAR